MTKEEQEAASHYADKAVYKSEIDFSFSSIDPSSICSSYADKDVIFDVVEEAFRAGLAHGRKGYIKAETAVKEVARQMFYISKFFGSSIRFDEDDIADGIACNWEKAKEALGLNE